MQLLHRDPVHQPGTRSSDSAAGTPDCQLARVPTAGGCQPWSLPIPVPSASPGPRAGLPRRLHEITFGAGAYPNQSNASSASSSGSSSGSSSATSGSGVGSSPAGSFHGGSTAGAERSSEDNGSDPRARDPASGSHSLATAPAVTLAASALAPEPRADRRTPSTSWPHAGRALVRSARNSDHAVPSATPHIK